MSLNCWTLWQRMPPRYQLTMRDVRPEDDATQGRSVTPSPPSRVSSASPRSPRLRSPRNARRLGSARARLSGDGAMLTSGVLPEEYARETDYGPQSPVLPSRSSPYINTMKSQMRINSARRKLDESGMTSPTPKSYTPKPRATTAPAFPITKLSNHESLLPQRVTSPRHHHHHHDHHSDDVQQGPKNKQQRGFTGMRSPKRPSSGYARLDPKRVSVHTIAPFGELSAEGSSPVFHPRSPRQQDCVIGDYQVAALYLDKGRVTFFRKTKPDVAQSVYSAMNPFTTTRDDGSYLAHLRKFYLSGVRDMPKITSKQPDMEKHATIQQRMDYDRKVGKILDYYAKVDIPKQVHAPRPPNSQSTQTKPPQPQTAFRTLSSRKRAPRSTDISDECCWPEDAAMDGTQFSPRLHQYHSHPHHFHMRDASGFVRINAQARLHDRQFYLRTPHGLEAVASSDPQVASRMQDMANCTCSMCRLEMEVALMAQLQREMGVPLEAFTSAVPAPDQPLAAAANPASPRQAPLGVVTEEDSCPTRPNSMSDSRKHAQVATHPPPGQQQAAAQAGQAGSEGPQNVESSQAPRLPSEPASLTVTLPGVDESSDVGTGAAPTEREGHGDGNLDTAQPEVADVPHDKATQHTETNDDSRPANTENTTGDEREDGGQAETAKCEGAEVIKAPESVQHPAVSGSEGSEDTEKTPDHLAGTPENVDKATESGSNSTLTADKPSEPGQQAEENVDGSVESDVHTEENNKLKSDTQDNEYTGRSPEADAPAEESVVKPADSTEQVQTIVSPVDKEPEASDTAQQKGPPQIGEAEVAGSAESAVL